MDQAEISGEAAMKGKAFAAEHGIGWSESAGGEFRGGPEERVHETMDAAGAEAREAITRDCKIGEEPGCVGHCGAGDFSDEMLELIGTKTIEEEVRDDQVERGGRQREFESVRVNESDVRRRMIEGANPILREGEHPFAGIHTGDLRGRKLLAKRREKFTRTFAEDQD